MFVPHARVRLVGMPNRGQRRRELGRRQRAARRKLKVRDLMRMPCLFPTCASCLLGLFVLLGGVSMAVVGYHPAFGDIITIIHNETDVTDAAEATTVNVTVQYEIYRHPAIKSLSYIGPILMGCGLFVMIVSGVLYCEIVDKYVSIPPEKTKLPKEELYDFIIEEFRKNYFRGIEVPLQKLDHAKRRNDSVKRTLFRALSISTPALLLTPEISTRWKKEDKIETSPDTLKEKIKLKILPTEDPWIKTSSLPNIRPLEGPVAKTSSIQNVSKKHLRNKRMSRSCGNVIDIFQYPGENGKFSSSGFDNPAYLPDPVRGKISVEGDKDEGQTTNQEKVMIDNLPDTPVHSWKSEMCDHVQFKDSLAPPSDSNKDSVDDSRSNVMDDTAQLSSGDKCESENSKHKAKHVSVIVHEASVHQPADVQDLYNMQVSTVKSVYSFTEKDTANDDQRLDVRQTGPYKTCIGFVHRNESNSPNSKNRVALSIEDDSDSHESLALSDDEMLNFERTQVTHL